MEPFRNSAESMIRTGRDPPSDIAHESDSGNLAGSSARGIRVRAEAIHRRPGVPPNLITPKEQR